MIARLFAALTCGRRVRSMAVEFGPTLAGACPRVADLGLLSPAEARRLLTQPAHPDLTEASR